MESEPANESVLSPGGDAVEVRVARSFSPLAVLQRQGRSARSLPRGSERRTMARSCSPVLQRGLQEVVSWQGCSPAADEARGPAPEPFTWNGTQPA
eukprot:COSAG01_NODE_1263_length_10996_cov_70.459117_7_plen_96_part_00